MADGDLERLIACLKTDATGSAYFAGYTKAWAFMLSNE